MLVFRIWPQVISVKTIVKHTHPLMPPHLKSHRKFLDFFGSEPALNSLISTYTGIIYCNFNSVYISDMVGIQCAR